MNNNILFNTAATCSNKYTVWWEQRWYCTHQIIHHVSCTRWCVADHHTDTHTRTTHAHTDHTHTDTHTQTHTQRHTSYKSDCLLCIHCKQVHVHTLLCLSGFPVLTSCLFFIRQTWILQRQFKKCHHCQWKWHQLWHQYELKALGAYTENQPTPPTLHPTPPPPPTHTHTHTHTHPHTHKQCHTTSEQILLIRHTEKVPCSMCGFFLLWWSPLPCEKHWISDSAYRCTLYALFVEISHKSIHGCILPATCNISGQGFPSPRVPKRIQAGPHGKTVVGAI